jgi:hypothetical protein
MKNWLILLFSVCCFIQPLSSQYVSPEVVSSNGGTGTAAGIQLEWTLGEPAIEGRTGQQQSFTEGFHQPVILVEQVALTSSHIGTRSEHEHLSWISVSPNPVATELTIRFVSDTGEQYYCQVRDANGALISQRTLNTLDGNAEMDVADLAAGLYFLHFIAADDGEVSVFKVVKIK